MYLSVYYADIDLKLGVVVGCNSLYTRRQHKSESLAWEVLWFLPEMAGFYVLDLNVHLLLYSYSYVGLSPANNELYNIK